MHRTPPVHYTLEVSTLIRLVQRQHSLVTLTKTLKRDSPASLSWSVYFPPNNTVTTSCDSLGRSQDAMRASTSTTRPSSDVLELINDSILTLSKSRGWWETIVKESSPVPSFLTFRLIGVFIDTQLFSVPTSSWSIIQDLSSGWARSVWPWPCQRQCRVWRSENSGLWRGVSDESNNRRGGLTGDSKGSKTNNVCVRHPGSEKHKQAHQRDTQRGSHSCNHGPQNGVVDKDGHVNLFDTSKCLGNILQV